MLAIDLTGKVVLVVGGSRGIGAGIVESLCRAGATTIFTHTGNSQHNDQVEDLLVRMKNTNGSAKAAALDARDDTKTTELVNQIVREHKKIDSLVVNVGQNTERKAKDLSCSQWDQCIELNLSAAFYAVRSVLKHMVEAGYGRIILIGSSASYNGGGGAIDYAAAKAGLSGMMMYLCKEYSRKGILTNIVAPSLIGTDLLQERYSDTESIEKLISQIPAGRLGKPEDIANLVAYLASPWGDFICGQSILVDGGRTLWH